MTDSAAKTSPAVPLLAHRGIQFLLLILSGMAALYARSAVSAIQEAIRLALSLSDNQMALLQGPALGLPFMVLSIPIGLAIDRYSRSRILLLIAALNFLGTIATALAPNFAILFLARALIGVAATTISPVAFSLLADLYPPSQRGRASMAVMIGQFGGIAAAFAIGGALAGAFSAEPNAWRTTMLWIGVPLFPIMLMLLVMREPERIGRGEHQLPRRAALRELWQYRSVIAPLMAGLVTAEIASGSLFVWAAPSFSRRFALAPDKLGAIMSLVVLAGGIVGSIVGGVLADVCQREGGSGRTISLLSALALVSVIPAYLLVAMTQILWATTVLVVLMVIIFAIIVGGMALITIVIPNRLRGLALASMVAANILFGTALAPITVSALSGALGGSAAIGDALSVVCAAAGMIGACAFLVGRRILLTSTAPESFPANRPT